MESVRVVIPITEEYEPGSSLRIYGSEAGGSIDFDNPISGKIPIWPQRAVGKVRGQTRKGTYTRGSGVGFGGRGQGVRGHITRGRFQDVVVWVGAQLYGPAGGSKVFKFAAKIFDPQGRVSAINPSASEQVTVVVNSAPRAASGLTPSSLSAGAITFTFTPSQDL